MKHISFDVMKILYTVMLFQLCLHLVIEFRTRLPNLFFVLKFCGFSRLENFNFGLNDRRTNSSPICVFCFLSGLWVRYDLLALTFDGFPGRYRFEVAFTGV